MVVRSGGVALSRRVLDREATLDHVGRGELIGLASGPRASTAIVHGDAALFIIPRAAFERWLVEHPAMAVPVLDAFAARARRLAERLALVSMHGARARLALLLLDLAERFGVRDARGTIVDLRLTHRELAGLLGATRETVSVAIIGLRDAGVVATEARRVVVLDADALRRVASGLG